MKTLYKRSVKETYIAIGINNWNINTVAITIAKILDFIEVPYDYCDDWENEGLKTAHVDFVGYATYFDHIGFSSGKEREIMSITCRRSSRLKVSRVSLLHLVYRKYDFITFVCICEDYVTDYLMMT